MSDNKLNNKNNKPKPSFPVWVIYIVLLVLLLGFPLAGSYFGPSKIVSSKFKEYYANGDIKEILKVKEESYYYVEVTLTKEALVSEEHKSKVRGADLGPHYVFDVLDMGDFNDELEELKTQYPAVSIRIDETQRKPSQWEDMLQYLLIFGLIIGVWVFMMRRMGGGGGPGGQIFNIGKSKAKLFDKDTNVEITFENVAGLDEAKQEVMEIVDFLKNPKKYTVLGAKIPKGALLVGPPGTGKTLIAKAVAGEAKVPFFSLSGSDFVEMFVGVGASRVRDLFKQAKEKSPCIIFIDEIDAIGRARGKSPAQNANDERENTLNQLLTEMDGFGTNSGIIVIAATNRADILDRALMRPGRFDRQIYVDMPDLNERKEIFKVHLKPIKIDDTVDIDFLARQTPGFSGADIANICNEAALIAARTNKKNVDKQDFLNAVDRIIGGLEKKNKVIKPNEKKTIAYHEAGHATVSWLLEHASPLVKVTIVPRGRSLGAAWYLPEERQITTHVQIFHEMCAALGGRAAEEIVFGEISTGALSDLEKVTKQAKAVVMIYGLNDRLGNISYYDSSGQQDYSLQKPYSEKTAEVIDDEISKLIESAYAEAKKILSENRDKLELLANALLEKEVIFKEDLEEIFGKRPFGQDETEEQKAEVVETSEQSPNISEENSDDESETPKSE
jgi:cell division protease FtsH